MKRKSAKVQTPQYVNVSVNGYLSLHVLATCSGCTTTARPSTAGISFKHQPRPLRGASGIWRANTIIGKFYTHFMAGVLQQYKATPRSSVSVYEPPPPPSNCGGRAPQLGRVNNGLLCFGLHVEKDHSGVQSAGRSALNRATVWREGAAVVQDSTQVTSPNVCMLACWRTQQKSWHWLAAWHSSVPLNVSELHNEDSERDQTYICKISTTEAEHTVLSGSTVLQQKELKR